MRKRGALYGLSSTKNYRIKVDGTNEDSVEVLAIDSSEACVLQSSLHVDSHESNKLKEKPVDEAEKAPEEESEKDSEEAEGDTEEELTDEAAKAPEEGSTEESEKDPEEETSEETEEDTEEESTDEAEMDPEELELEKDPKEEMTEAEEDFNEESTEELEEEVNEESSECESLSKCCYNDPEHFVEDFGDDLVSKLSSEIDVVEDEHQSEYALNTLNEKKRSVDATIDASTPSQTHSRKKSRQESSKSTSESGFGITDLGTDYGVSKAVIAKDTSAQKEETGSSGKRRRTRWDTQPGGDCEMGEGDRISKRRKTRWDVDDSQLKMLGPIQLANFMEKFLDESNWDLEILELKERLLELNSILKCSDLQDEKSEEEISVKLRNKLIRERQDVISRLINKNPMFQTPPDYKPQKHSKKLYIPVKEYPESNFVGLILGPRGNTQKRMEKETGARIFLRGKGSSRTPQKKADPSDNDDLHVLIEADNQKSLDAAVVVVEKLLNPFNEGWSEHKVAQLKELSKLNGTHRDENKCSVCLEEGHIHYACPSLQSTFNSHSTTTCTLTASSPAGKYLRNSPGLGLGLTPNSNKEINDANLFVGYLPPGIDDNRLSELFSPFGKLTEVKVIKDRTTGLSKGYGFVKFENPTDAAAAIVHTNGLKMDGKMLAVRIAGRQQVSGLSAFSHLPLYPGPIAVSPVVPGQMSLLPSFIGPAIVSPVAPGQTSLQPSCVYLEQIGLLPQSESFGFSTPSSISSFPGSLSATSLSSSYQCSNKLQFLSPNPLAQFPGNLDYPGSYLATPAIRSSPSSFAQFPGDPDYPGTQFL